jgi:hypothetical protein
MLQNEVATNFQINQKIYIKEVNVKYIDVVEVVICAASTRTKWYWSL